jgi:FixJ family two-component response regulator
VRFLVTGNRDIDVAVRAVNEGAVHRYFLKPWDEHKLRDALDLQIRARTSSAPKPAE